MPIPPDGGIWGSLLSACKIHNDAEFGIKVAKHAIKADPENDGYYVMIADLYTSLERWDEAENVRVKMKEMGVRKSAGWSTVYSEQGGGLLSPTAAVIGIISIASEMTRGSKDGSIYKDELIEKRLKSGDVYRIPAGSTFYAVNTADGQQLHVICSVEKSDSMDWAHSSLSSSAEARIQHLYLLVSNAQPFLPH
ncbi:hypothetical protein C3L33_17518, partial [Rhododendron williamsianum]